MRFDPVHIRNECAKPCNRLPKRRRFILKARNCGEQAVWCERDQANGLVIDMLSSKRRFGSLSLRCSNLIAKAGGCFLEVFGFCRGLPAVLPGFIYNHLTVFFRRGRDFVVDGPSRLYRERQFASHGFSETRLLHALVDASNVRFGIERKGYELRRAFAEKRKLSIARKIGRTVPTGLECGYQASGQRRVSVIA